MQQPKRIVIIAGEESGDVHAASFVRELKERNPNLEISGIGGQHMHDAGVTLISDLARFGVTGLSEVIRHARVIRRAFQDIKAHLQTHKPDLLVLVDYPGFNLRLAKFAKRRLGIRVLYYISPQIWAWKANRIHTIRAYVDKMAVILPFEKKLYEQAGVPVSFVGHPLVDKIPVDQDIPTLKSKLDLPQNKRLIAILPGSRTNEIEHLMPVLRDTAIKLMNEHADLHFVIPVARTINPAVIQSYLSNTVLPYTLIKEQAVETIYCSDFAIVASGTASLECALLIKPMCIIYKGSWLSYLAACKLIRVKFLGLCNLLQNQMIVPELLQYDCNPLEISRAITDLMTNPDVSNRMIRRLQHLKNTLSIQQADFTISSLIEHELGTG
ncbi:MAG: lipid-A-disaccharide synthase [Legionellaceae bacterium]|nr:lipid-A-disaccharide synthase [Legionellaceae bacterium]